MKRVPVPGTEGYAEEAPSLIKQWATISFAEHHASTLRFLATEPSDILDIGAGIGGDAGAFAAMSHRVVAVEPTDAFRNHGMATHPGVTWLNDSLPDLSSLLARGGRFDVVTLMAVWMHLDASQRLRAMPPLVSVMREAAVMIMSLRHGPVPPGRRMFEVTADETIRLAGANGLHCLLNLPALSVQKENRRNGVSWTKLVFRKGDDLRVKK